VSLLTLGRCFGLFPEARGLVTHGPYRYVRHPVYLGEFISGFGLLLPRLAFSEHYVLRLPFSDAALALNLGALNLGIFVLFVALQLWRASNEERALTAVFPEYAEYRRRTARLLPGIY
jgi:protein-S-isoprenylcysteine O-methyltransferase Ste14